MFPSTARRELRVQVCCMEFIIRQSCLLTHSVAYYKLTTYHSTPLLYNVSNIYYFILNYNNLI